MIIPAKSQFNWLEWFLTRRFFKFRPIRTHYVHWQPCWISDQCEKQKSCILPSNEHFCQVWFKSVLWFRKKRWKCEILIVVGCPVLKKTLSYTRLILVLNARKIITFCIFNCRRKFLWSRFFKFHVFQRYMYPRLTHCTWYFQDEK